MKIIKALFNHEHPYWVGCIGPDTQIYGYRLFEVSRAHPGRRFARVGP